MDSPGVASADSKTLYAVYDLDVSPMTFDIVHFLCLADIERREQGCDFIQPILVPGAAGRYRQGTAHDNLFDEAQKDWRLNHMIIPSCWHLPVSRSLILCEDREQANSILDNVQGPIYPENYTVDEPTKGWEPYKFVVQSCKGKELGSVEATDQGREYARRWIDSHAQGKKVVAITLRETKYLDFRNSDVESWLTFARSLDPEIYFPVILRDHDRIFEPAGPEFEGLALFPEAVVNLEVRAAFYELAYLNVFLASGPTEYCWMNSAVRYVMFVPWALVEDPAVQWSVGMPVGAQLPFATPYQKWVWEKDTPETIRREFEQMSKKIDEAGDDAFKRHAFSPKEQDPIKWLERAKALISVNQFEPGEELLKLAMPHPEVSKNPDHAVDLWTLLGDLNIYWQNYQKGWECISQAAEADPSNASFQNRLGFICAKMGRGEDSEAHYERATKLAPDRLEYQIRLAVVKHARGDFEGALVLFQNAINQGYRSAIIYEQVSETLKMLGRLKESAAYLIEAAELPRYELPLEYTDPSTWRV